MEAKIKGKFKGVFEVECFRYGELIWTEKFENLITNEGLDHILDGILTGKTAIDPWYCVMAEDDVTPLATHDYAAPGYTETTSYDEATRPIYDEAASSGQSVTNSANKAVFTISATKTMYGAAIVGGSAVKSNVTDDSAHVLLASAQFGTPRAVVDNDVINLTYTIDAADDGV